MKKTIPFAAVLLLLCLIFSGCGKNEKLFYSTHLTISIKPPEDFRQVEIEGLAAAYESDYMAIRVLRERFESYEGVDDRINKDTSALEYAQFLTEVNKGTEGNAFTEGDLTLFYFTQSGSEKKFRGAAYVYKSVDSFWTVQFITEKDQFDTYRDQIVEMALSVGFRMVSNV